MPSKKDDSTGLEVGKVEQGADARVKHVDDESESLKITEMSSMSKDVQENMFESEKELQERSRGLIHKDARLWFVPPIMILIVLGVVIYWGITGRSSKNDELFDKIINSQDKFETVRTLRYAEQHEIYYGFYVIILGIIIAVLGAAGLAASRAYTVSDARNVGTIGMKAALLSKAQMVQIRQDQEDKTELKEEVKSKEKEIVLSEERRRETQEKLTVTEKELELNKQQLEEEKRMHMLREKMHKDEVTRLKSDNDRLESDLHHEKRLLATADNELKNQREMSKMEGYHLRERIYAAERDRWEAQNEAEYHKGLAASAVHSRTVHSRTVKVCVCM